MLSEWNRPWGPDAQREVTGPYNLLPAHTPAALLFSLPFRSLLPRMQPRPTSPQARPFHWALAQIALLGLLCLPCTDASLTIYGPKGVIQQAMGVQTSTASSVNADATALPAYNNVVLQPPAVPNPPPATQFGLTVQSSAADVVGLSIKLPSAFYGFSIEFSVVNQVGGWRRCQGTWAI